MAGPSYTNLEAGASPFEGAGARRQITTTKRGATLKRRATTMNQPNRQATLRRLVTNSAPNPKVSPVAPPPSRRCPSAWQAFSWAMTCCFPPFLLSLCRIKGKGPQQAWREKVALCWIVFFLGAVVVFFVVFFNPLMCPPNVANNAVPPNAFGGVVVHGTMYNANAAPPPLNSLFENLPGGADVSDISFLPPNSTACQQPDTISASFANTPSLCQSVPSACEDINILISRGFSPYNVIDGTDGRVWVDPVTTYDWDLIRKRKYVVVDDWVLDLAPYFRSYPSAIAGDIIDAALREAARHVDGTHIFSRTANLNARSNAYACIVNRFKVGKIEELPARCMISRLITFLFALVVMGILLARFFMALIFTWFLSNNLTRDPNLKKLNKAGTYADMGTLPFTPHLHHKHSTDSMELLQRQSIISEPSSILTADDERLDLYTILLVTCYSENEASLRTTMESLAGTDYPDRKKLLFVVADGIVTGKGNPKSTPELVLDMVEIDGGLGEPVACSYEAVAGGAKKHNMAKVYCGHFVHAGHRVPTVVIVKCGPPSEATEAKPGNRGKRDSQLILMHFLSHVLLNDRMTPLDYDLFRKIHHITHVTPDLFEIVLMVDADTRVKSSSLRYMINAMHNGPDIMGLCGETRIANKTQSWVTMIQVFEYYISHHLGKGFESVFGGVTCLPGCFCMYRIKSRKIEGEGIGGVTKWVPILANPDVVEEYSTDEVETLHQKNLLFLGEDRFLTTLMLRTFPARKMVFVPKSVCHTVVPDDFRTLLSQRRRWINSTIHNLMELVLVSNLCGIFCFSMQFVILMDLISTAVLPAALAATIYLIVDTIIRSAWTDPAQWVTLGTMAFTLFFPLLVVLLSFRRVHYAGWMFVYMLALPIWNIVLPLYAFWHFDDFSWGATRKVDGVRGAKDDHGSDDKKSKGFSGEVERRKWEEWERERRWSEAKVLEERRKMEKGKGRAVEVERVGPGGVPYAPGG
ncbi:hypothetical protein HK097_010854, partial [Rhizophlyctis rosea]